MPNSRQPDRTGKIKQDEFNLNFSEWQCQKVTCTNCGSKDTTPITELTHECNECETMIYLDNLPPTDEDRRLDDGFNMYLNDEF